MAEWSNVYRLCRRCQRWRRIGQFSVQVTNGKTYNGHHCHVCWRKGLPHGKRAGYVLTEKARAYLREFAA